MEDKKVKAGNVAVGICLFVIAILLVLIVVFFYNTTMEKNKLQAQIDELETEVKEKNNEINNFEEKHTDDSEVEEELETSENQNDKNDNESFEIIEDKEEINRLRSNEDILLYQGEKIEKKIGKYPVTFEGMKIDKESIHNYNTIYYNYENGKYEGVSIGNFGGEKTMTVEEHARVDNVKKIAFTKEHNRIPREYKIINEVPEELKNLPEYTSVEIHSIDLDGDGKEEKLVSYKIDYTEEESKNGEMQASSYIDLYDSNYKKIANLVSLEDGFWAGIRDEQYKMFISLENIEYIDVDEDNIMELVVEIPCYDMLEVNILKYKNGKIQGETDIKATLMP